MEMSCAAVKEILPAYSREGESSLSVRRHLSRCADCHGELARYEHLLGSLSAMESAVVDVPARLKTSLLSIPERAGRLESVRSHVTVNRKAYLSGAAVLTAGTVAAALWRSRSRGPATA